MYQKTNIFLRCTMVSRGEEKGKVLWKWVQEWKITGFGKGVL
ncbi:MAG: hypothetical protein Q4Q26_08125 [Eubacteriales bacterium]|nr:hypothetical protein [Eubacteriales bacterium]